MLVRCISSCLCLNLPLVLLLPSSALVAGTSAAGSLDEKDGALIDRLAPRPVASLLHGFGLYTPEPKQSKTKTGEESITVSTRYT